ncbi:MAG: glycosyltransferase [Candidatus Rokubacteria bacterium]|nr:glycosyltransferase [Candidatus Rokubacteria bacterium]
MLSIIIPTLNEERYLPHLLASVRRQQFIEYEVIVSDGGSADRTLMIAERFSCRVVLGPAKSPGYQRNRGAEVARGEDLLFLDADTVLPDEEFLAKALAEFVQQEITVASCSAEPLERAIRYHALLACSNLFLRVMERVYPHVYGGMILARRQHHETVGGFDEAPIIGEDGDYVRRLGRLGRFRLLQGVRILVSMRRFQQYGIPQMLAVNTLATLLRSLGGSPRYDRFGYRFGHYEGTPCSMQQQQVARAIGLLLVAERYRGRDTVSSETPGTGT